MKNPTQARLTARQVKKSVRDEVRGKVMRNRIRAKAELLISDLDETISDEVGELMGKLSTDFIDEESGTEAASYVFEQIRKALLGEVKRQLK